MLSKKTQYGLKALGYLASKYGQGPVLISEIAKKKKIPIKFLESILLQLKNKGVLDSKKGKGGGYFLASSPRKTTLASAIRIVDGPIAMIPCVSLNFYESCSECKHEETCGLRDVVLEVREASIKILSKTSLADILKREKKLEKKQRML